MLFKDIKLVNEAFDVVEHQYVLVENETITYIGDTAPQNYQGEIYDGTNKLLVPGLYNMHCHIPMTILRGYGSGLNLQDWLFTKIFPFEDKLTAEDICVSTDLGLCELISSGCCSFSDTYFSTPSYAKNIFDSGRKANISECCSCNDDEIDFKDATKFKIVTELIERCKDGEFGTRVVAEAALHAIYTSSKNYMEQFCQWANSNNLTKHVHLSETITEQEDCKAKYGVTPAKFFYDIGLFEGKQTLAAHGVHLTEEDQDILLSNNVAVARCYSSNLKLASGCKPLRPNFIKKGLELIGTDGASSNNNLNMLEEMHIAALNGACTPTNPLHVLPKDILKMVTVDSAKFQGREKCGIIKEGYKADMFVVDLDKPHMQPDTDTIYNLFYSAQSSDIVVNMVDGKVLYKDGEYLTIDIEKAKSKTSESFNRIIKSI